MTGMSYVSITPSSAQRKQARKLLESSKDYEIMITLKKRGSRKEIELQKALREYVLKVLEMIIEADEGKMLTFVEDEIISTQKAADILNISRPYFVKLLESGAIPFDKVGAHRRVAMKDIIEYRDKKQKKRKETLKKLAAHSQKYDLGY